LQIIKEVIKKTWQNFKKGVEGIYCFSVKGETVHAILCFMWRVW
jgi:hypothetical protein